MLKNILVLTPIYPADDVHKSTTPVVHYFTREWVKLGYNVLVIHYPVNFPNFVYRLISPFKEIIASKVGSEIRTWQVQETEYLLEGVKVKRFPMTKMKPHGRYSQKQICQAVNNTIEYCRTIGFKPNVIISHWVNPSFEIMHYLKAYYNVPTCYVAHDDGHDLKTIMKDMTDTLIQETDIIGYRSDAIKRHFESYFKCKDKRSFLCSSGIPSSYLTNNKKRLSSIKNFIFVGTLIQRKYPAEIVPAIAKAYGNKEFTITYIGDGAEIEQIKKFATEYNIEKNIYLLGRMPRNEVVAQLDKSDVFVMISRGETFGLVYLEAMARGCITIASRDEGFDGVIVDGENGFLCESGNIEELASIVSNLRRMNSEDLSRISRNAIDTAYNLTDDKAARRYLENVLSIMS